MVPPETVTSGIDTGTPVGILLAMFGILVTGAANYFQARANGKVSETGAVAATKDVLEIVRTEMHDLKTKLDECEKERGSDPTGRHAPSEDGG
jgi:hypothetical protein